MNTDKTHKKHLFFTRDYPHNI